MKKTNLKLIALFVLLLITSCVGGKSSEKLTSESLSGDASTLSSVTTTSGSTSQTSTSQPSDESSEESSIVISSESGIPYNVTFVTNCETTLDPVYTDVIYDMPVIFREGFTLEGWYLEATFVNIVSFPFYVPHDVTLYAKWTEGETALFTFELKADNSGYIVTSYGGNAINVVVPTTYNNKPVVALGEQLFYQNGSIKAVVLPATLTYIGHQAFKDAVSLESIVLPSGVTELAADAFAGTISLSQVTLSSNLEIIGNNAFENSAFSSVTIPAKVVEINSRSFAGNTALVTVILTPNTPPLRFANSFEGTVSNLKYYVPAAVYDAYINSPYWQGFSAQIVAN